MSAQTQEPTGTARRLPRALTLVAALSVVTTAPLLGIALRADELINPYLFGPLRARSPLTIFTYPVSVTETYIELGNFRPLGRLVEQANYLLQDRIATLTDVPMNIVIGFDRTASSILLGLLLVWFAHRLLAPLAEPRQHAAALTLVALVYPTLLIGTWNSSAVVVFSGMYFQTTAFLVLSALVFTIPSLYMPGRIQFPYLAGLFLLGAALASFNALTFLAVPLIAAVTLTNIRVHRLSLRQILRRPIFPATLMTSVGFLAAAIPSRIAIARACATNTCYDNSAIDLAGWTPDLFAARLLSGLPFPAWGYEHQEIIEASLIPLIGLFALAIFALLWRSIDASTVGARSNRDRHSSLVPLLAAGFAMVFFAALLSSLSAGVQGSWKAAMGWRESPVAYAGWALIFAGLGAWVALRLPRRTFLCILLTVPLALALSLTVSTNVAKQARETNDQKSILSNRIASSMATFDPTEAGRHRRCKQLERFRELHPKAQSVRQKLHTGLNRAAQARYGQPFCDRPFDGG